MTEIEKIEGKIAGRENQMKSLRDTLKTEDRVRTDEESENWDKWKKELKGWKDRLEDEKEQVQEKAKKATIIHSEEPKKEPKKEVDNSIDDKLKKLRSTAYSPLSASNEIELNIRTAVTASSVTDNTDAEVIPGIAAYAHRKLKLYDLFEKIPVSKDKNGTVKYTDWDEASTTEAAATIAEGGAYPESQASWREYTDSLKKIGDSIPITEESLYDRSRFTKEVEKFLKTNVDKVTDQQIYNGNNTGNNLNGLYTRSSAYTPVALGIPDASIYDLLVKVRTSIEQGKDSKFSANVAIMNRTDIDKYKLKKDANNNYVMPPFVDRNGQVIDGMLVIESNAVTANTCVVGDSNFGSIHEQPGVFVGTGTVNDQFTKDLITMKVRRRLLFLIRNVELGAWRKVTDIDAALVTLATAP